MSAANHTPSHSLSDEEAQKEHDDIQREIAKSKGQEYKPESEDDEPKDPDEEKGDEDEPGDKLGDEDDKKKKIDSKTPDDDEPEPGDVDPLDPDETKPRRKSLLGKYQSEKKEWATEKADLARQIEELSTKLNRTETAEKMKEKVSAYAEKHGMSEEAVMDLLLLNKESTQPDPIVRATLEESRALIQKNKAVEAFENEFASLVDEVPEAKAMRDKIRAEAYKEGNLEKSLYEIYHRIQTKPVEKRRGGEAQRGAPGREAAATSFDVQKVAERVKKGEKGAMSNLTGEQTDEVFAYLDKEGSRYSK